MIPSTAQRHPSLTVKLQVYQGLRPGVEYYDMHELAERTMAGHLINLGYLQGTVEEVNASS